MPNGNGVPTLNEILHADYRKMASNAWHHDYQNSYEQAKNYDYLSAVGTWLEDFDNVRILVDAASLLVGALYTPALMLGAGCFLYNAVNFLMTLNINAKHDAVKDLLNMGVLVLAHSLFSSFIPALAFYAAGRHLVSLLSTQARVSEKADAMKPDHQPEPLAPKPIFARYKGASSDLWTGVKQDLSQFWARKNTSEEGEQFDESPVNGFGSG